MLNLMAAAALWVLAMPQSSIIMPEIVEGQMVLHPPPGLVAGKQLPQFLTSGDNDLIVVHQTKSGASPPDSVQVCIVNRSRSGGRKAFDNHRTGQPRYIADSGQTDCGNIHPTQQDFFFWKTDSDGGLKPVLKQKLNLAGYAGYSIRFEWLDD